MYTASSYVLTADQIHQQIHQSSTITHLDLGLAIFGSARTLPTHADYKDAYHLACLAAQNGVAVISGGGPGIMTAANRGAFENGGVAIGLNITLPNEQHANEFQTYSLLYEHFSPRKMAFVSHSAAFAVYPGGFGTLDELFEVLTLIQTNKAEPKPVVLIGQAYWQGLVSWASEQLIGRGMIGKNDLSLVHIVNSAEEAWTYLKPTFEKQIISHPESSFNI